MLFVDQGLMPPMKLTDNAKKKGDRSRQGWGCFAANVDR